jgi:hypothetical protein
MLQLVGGTRPGSSWSLLLNVASNAYLSLKARPRQRLRFGRSFTRPLVCRHSVRQSVVFPVEHTHFAVGGLLLT